MIFYTIMGLLICPYLGCCDSHSTWQTFAGKTVPTALGALWGFVVTALLLPKYASHDMLQAQADILRAAHDSMRRYAFGGWWLGCCVWASGTRSTGRLALLCHPRISCTTLLPANPSYPPTPPPRSLAPAANMKR